MKLGKMLIMATAIIVFGGINSFAGLVFDQVSFHDASHITSGGPEAEGGETDNGGTIYVFIRSTGGTYHFYNNPRDRVKIDGTYLRDHGNFRWARFWPKGINNGQTTVLIIKGIGAPFNEGANRHFEIWADDGTKLDFWAGLNTPTLRIGSVVPSNDNRSLYIFMRNTDPTYTWTVENVYDGINNWTPRCTFIGGSSVAVRDVLPIKVTFDDEWQMYEVKPQALRIFARRADGQYRKLGALVRVTKPIFPLGTWSGDLFNNGDIVRETREYAQHNFAGPAFAWGDPTRRMIENHMYSTPMPDAGNLPGSITDKRYHPGLYAWFIDDEPELSGRGSPQLRDLTEWVWDYDWLHPTMINNARNKQFQQYGMMVDHPCYDHYTQYAPLCYGGIGTTYSMKNSFWYAESLKKNCEPLRMWAYSQGVSTTTGWGSQPQPWGIRVQFWNEIAGGVKGIKWFMANSRGGYSGQYDAIQQEVRAFNNVRNLCLYGDVADRVNVSHGDMIARLICGEDACLVIVTNSSGWCTKNLFGYNVGMNELWDQSITFEVPWKYNVQQVQRVTENGLQSTPHYWNGRNLTCYDLDLSYAEPYRVFLIGKNDTQAPDAPKELNTSKWLNNSQVILSWDDAYDNYGIKGYKVYKNGQEIADVRSPIYQYNSASRDHEYTVKAYDAAGNLSAASRGIKAGAPVFTWDDEMNFEGWKELYNVYRPRVAPWGAMYMWTQSAANPNLISPDVRISASSKKNVKIYYYNATGGTNACLYFSNDGTNWNGYKWFNLTQNTWSWVTLNMNGVGGWSGDIKKFRLDLPAGGQGEWQIIYLNHFEVY